LSGAEGKPGAQSNLSGFYPFLPDRPSHLTEKATFRDPGPYKLNAQES